MSSKSRIYVPFDILFLLSPGTIEIFEVLMPPQVLAITTPHYKYHHDYATEIRHVQRAYVHVSLKFSCLLLIV